MLDQHRNWFKGLEKKTADIFAVLSLTPNQYTLLSIIFAIASAVEINYGNYLFALGLYLAAIFCDFIDGAVARRKNLSSNQGAYWDTVADRYVEAILFFGLLFVELPPFYLVPAAWIFLALFGSTMTTYAKAAAKEKGLSDVELKGGLMSRAERSMFCVAILLLLGYSKVWAMSFIVVLALLSNITAMQRISMALRRN